MKSAATAQSSSTKSAIVKSAAKMIAAAMVTAPAERKRHRRPAIISAIVRIAVIWIAAVIPGVIPIRLRVRNDIGGRGRHGLLNVSDRGSGGITLVAGGGRTGRRSGGFGGAGQAAALVQHGVQNVVGQTLLLEVNNLVRLQGLDRAGILDVIDDDTVADLGLRELQNLRHAVGKLRRGLARGGWLGGGGGFLCGNVARRKGKRGNGGDGQKQILKVFYFHNQHLNIEHPNFARVARTVNWKGGAAGPSPLRFKPFP